MSKIADLAGIPSSQGAPQTIAGMKQFPKSKNVEDVRHYSPLLNRPTKDANDIILASASLKTRQPPSANLLKNRSGNTLAAQAGLDHIGKPPATIEDLLAFGPGDGLPDLPVKR
jgi:hypothetical protein